MLEFSILLSNSSLTENRLQENEIEKVYNKRSIHTEISKVEKHFFMNKHGILLYKQKYQYQGNLVYIEANQFTFLVGYIVSPKLTNNPNQIVKNLHHILINSRDRDWLNQCLGEFIIGHYNGKTLKIVTSNGATHPVYYRESNEEIVISNRLSLTNISLMQYKPKINLLSQLQIIAYDSIFNEETTFQDSICLERGYDLKVELRENQPVIHKEINPLFLGSMYINDPFDALKAIQEHTIWYLDAVELFSRQVDFSKGMDFFLSGGKDSRLLLSSFKKTGLINNFNQVVTLGSPGDAEVEAAKLVAKFYKLNHEIRSRGIAKNIFFERLPYHIYHMEGEINARILSGNYSGLRKPEFTGHEIGLREAFLDTESINNEQDLFHYIDNRFPIDPIGFMKSEISEKLKTEIKQIYYNSTVFNIDARNFLNYFIIIGRGPRWAGKVTSMNSAAGLYVNLLINSQLLTLSHRIGVNNRHLELMHLGMFQTIDKNILRIPFAKQSWPDETLKLFKRKFKLPKISLEDNLKNKNYNKFANQWWDAIYYKDEGRYIKQILHELRHPDLDQVIDYNLVNYYIDSAKKVSGRAMLSIYGIISSSLLLHSGDVTTDHIDKTKDIISSVLKSVEKGYQPTLNVKTKNVMRLPIKNIIYKSFYHQNPMGSDRIRLMSVKINEVLYEGIFVHSGNEIDIILPFDTTYTLDVNTFVLPQVTDKCSEQIFELIQNEKTIYKYQYPKDNNKIQTITIKGAKIKLKVHSPISTQYGWCLFVLDNIRFNEEVEK